MDKNRIQSVFLQHGENFRRENNLSVVQLKAMQAIEKCATEHYGFHSFICDSCQHTQIAYNSCRNRHCPHCQWVKQEIWIDKVKSTLLPVKYVHIVFTLPEFLNDFVLINHKLIYDILFEASWHALNKCAASYLAVQTGAFPYYILGGKISRCIRTYICWFLPEDWIQTGCNGLLQTKSFSCPLRYFQRYSGQGLCSCCWVLCSTSP